MRLSHNLASLNIFQEQSKVLQKQSTALDRISSGYKANKTKDDPNAIAQSERFRMQIRGTQMAARNTQDGISMLQTAEGALSSVNEILIRIKELAVQAGNGSNSDEDRGIIQNEINSMLEGLDDIVDNTEFNGVKLLANEKAVSNNAPHIEMMPIGANVGENLAIPMYNIKADKLFPEKIDLSQVDGTNKALENIDKAIESVLSINSKYGAIENRLDSGYASLNEISDKMQAAESSIRDADIALEMIEYAKGNILVDAGNALMAQTNKFPQDVLRILENMR
jgi:flagellin